MDPRRARIAFGFVCVSYAVVLAWLAVTLPDRVPMHFDLAGNPDSWSGKTTALLFWAGIGLVILGGGALLARLNLGDGTWLNMPPSYKDYWLAPERRAEFQRGFTADMLVVMAWTGLLLIGAMVVTRLAAGGVSIPGWWFGVGLAVYVLGTAVWTIALYRRYRPPASRG